VSDTEGPDGVQPPPEGLSTGAIPAVGSPEPVAAPTAPVPVHLGIMQPKYLASLGVVAVLVLVAGVIAIASGGNGDSVATDEATTIPVDDVISSVPLTTTPIPVPPSSTTTSTSTTTTTTTSTTQPPALAVANAGDDLAVDTAAEFALAAFDLSDENQSVVWTQIEGPPVIAEGARLVGVEVVLTAPSRPAMLMFEVGVTGRGGELVTDQIRVDVFEDADRAVFVDGMAGSADGDGSRERPYDRITVGLQTARQRGADLYLRSLPEGQGYETGEINDVEFSVYGGYDADWVRDVNDRAVIFGRERITLVVSGERPIVLSAIDVRGPGSSTDLSAGVVVANAADVTIEDSLIFSGNSAGVAFGLAAEQSGRLSLDRVAITAGKGGPGLAGESPLDEGAAGRDGADASDRIGGDTGISRGGDGGLGLQAGANGNGGASGGTVGEHGTPGAGGSAGAGGAGGGGGQGYTDGDSVFRQVGDAGLTGQNGSIGGVGGGGGGGGGVILHNGGGGGEGGAFGRSGAGGPGGSGGAASVAFFAATVDLIEMRNVMLVGGQAGAGGDGAAGAVGGGTGAGGSGAEGVSSFIDSGGNGGGGGAGGTGGQGGSGGGGAGGWSVGLVTIDVGRVVVADSRISGGNGGTSGVGGAGGQNGLTGSSGSGRSGGASVSGQDSGTAAAGQPFASGGDSFGWWDSGATEREVSNLEIKAGTPGLSGSEGGPAGQAIDTTF
jgi:hypothetical protein